MTNTLIHLARIEDESTLWVMLMCAARESPLAMVKANPDLARYVSGWGRKGDLGVIAAQDKTAVGAAWIRLWTENDCGYGYVAEDVPELAIAVTPEMRGKGIGSALLTKVLELAQSEFSAVCLSVRDDNPALRLYKRVGFARVAGSEVTNRTGTVSFTMLRRF